MKVTLLGATGKTGRYLIDEGLKRGMTLTVVARSSSPFGDPRVNVIRGDIADAGLLKEALQGARAVLSALGPSTPKHPPDLPVTRATLAVITAMEREGIPRLIALSTGTARAPEDGFDWKIRLPAWLVRFGLRSSYRDIVATAAAIRASTLDWTMVRVALLKSRPASGELHVGPYGQTRHGWAISREDVAAFMFDQISKPDFVGQAPGISGR